MKRAKSEVSVHTDDSGRVVLTVDGTEIVVAATIRHARGSAFSQEEAASIEESFVDTDWL
jgi:hypothetical protein